MEKAVSIVLINENGLILGVSRKDNHNDFSFIGGKVDPEDDDNIAAAIRETKEETGLDITNLQMIFSTHWEGMMQYTFIADYTGELHTDEPHIVKWLPFEVIENGSFKEYNKMVSLSLDSMGIKYKKYLDFDVLTKEVKTYVESTVRKGYTTPFKFLRLNKTTDGYIVNFDGDFEEEFDTLDENYGQGLNEIAARYNTVIRIPYYYYSK